MNNVTDTAAAGGALGLGFGLIALIFCMYFLPTLIAAIRRHRQFIAIAALNVLLGWTVLGWIASFIWSLTSPAQPQTIIVQQPAPPAPPQ